MSNSFGNLFKITTWGESHGNSIGVVIDGCPPGIEISLGFIQQELNRRRPGQSDVATQRNERDLAHLRSGVINNITTGMPITLEIFNEDADSSQYEDIKNKFITRIKDKFWKNYLAKYPREENKDLLFKELLRIDPGSLRMERHPFSFEDTLLSELKKKEINDFVIFLKEKLGS